MHKLSGAQQPKAIVLTCADSRVSPEIIFDQGLGDLFVIRNAGNVVDADVLGSMEYAIEHLGVRTVIVLGHESCGAVQATVKNLKTHNHIMNIERSIRPAFKLAEKMPGDSVHNTVVKNVELSMKRLNADKTLVPEKMDKETVSVYGAVYDIKTGKVSKINSL
jgi:carbonic anhydrase